MCYLLFFLIGLPLSLFSQKPIKTLVTKENYKPKTQFYFSIKPTLYGNLKTDVIGPNYLQPKKGKGLNIGTGIFVSIYNSIGISFGAEIEAIAFNYNFDFNEQINHPDFNTKTNINLSANEYLPSVNYYLLMVKKFKRVFKNKYLPNLSVGFKKNTVPNFGYGVSYSILSKDESESIRIFDSSIDHDSNHDKLSFSYYSYVFKLGLEKVDSRLNSYQLNFIFNYSPKDIATGTYSFKNIKNESFGTTALNPSYTGLEFTYGISIKKPKSSKKL